MAEHENRSAAFASASAVKMARWPTVICVSQLSFFSAESVPPAVADLTGMLAGPGQALLVSAVQGQAARLSVVVVENELPPPQGACKQPGASLEIRGHRAVPGTWEEQR